MRFVVLVLILVMTACSPRMNAALSGFGHGVSGNYSPGSERIRQNNHRWQVEQNQRTIIHSQRLQRSRSLQRNNVIK